MSLSSKAVHIFSTYATEDSKLLKELEKQLTILKKLGLIGSWHPQAINAGDAWKSSLDTYLKRSDIILLLISPDFLASDYFTDIQMARVLAQYQAGKASVIPILLRPTEWEDFPIARLQSLPRTNRGNVKALTLWDNKDLALTNIAQHLKKVILAFATRHIPATTFPPDEPVRLWNIPYSRNTYFIGRDSFLTDLHNRFTSQRSAFPTTLALVGLGGIGKTQIALEYAYRYRDNYQAVFWIKADSHENLVTDFMHLADILMLPERTGSEQAYVLGAVKRWLQSHDSWLLIFDNVEDSNVIADYLPTAGKGDSIITCRNRSTGRVIDTLDVNAIEVEEGALFLLRRAKIIRQQDLLEVAPTGDVENAREIAQLLDGHPLALDQAGAYIAETQTSLSNYILLYAQHGALLLKQRGASYSEHPTPIATTFLLSLQQVEKANPVAIALLQLCAFLYPDTIPEELFIDDSPIYSSITPHIVSATFEFNAAMKDLFNFSLIQRNTETNSITLHRLVQLVVKNELDATEQHQWAERAVQAVNRVFPKVEFEAWFLCQRYLPHALTCADLIKQWKIETPEAGRLVDATASYLYELAQYPTAQTLFEQALAIRQRVLGSEHPATAQTLNNLGELARKQGQHDDAGRFYHHALAIRQRVLGSEHPATAQTLNNLGELSQTQGDYVLAQDFYQQALTIRESVLGREHPDTIKSLGDVAGIYDELGDYIQAELLYKQALTRCEKVQGPNHPDTALALGKLARFYRSQARYAQAEPLFTRALAATEHQLGAEHPEVATLFNNFAILYRETGEYARAEHMLNQAIAIWTQVFGMEHRNTAASLHNLATVYSQQGEYEKAEQFYKQALSIRERTLGADHPETAKTLVSLGDLYVAQHKDVEATSLYKRALQIYQHNLGLDHPNTIAVLQRYTTSLKEPGA